MPSDCHLCFDERALRIEPSPGERQHIVQLGAPRRRQRLTQGANQQAGSCLGSRRGEANPRPAVPACRDHPTNSEHPVDDRPGGVPSPGCRQPDRRPGPRPDPTARSGQSAHAGRRRLRLHRRSPAGACAHGQDRTKCPHRGACAPHAHRAPGPVPQAERHRRRSPCALPLRRARWHSARPTRHTSRPRLPRRGSPPPPAAAERTTALLRPGGVETGIFRAAEIQGEFLLQGHRSRLHRDPCRRASSCSSRRRSANSAATEATPRRGRRRRAPAITWITARTARTPAPSQTSITRRSAADVRRPSRSASDSEATPRERIVRTSTAAAAAKSAGGTNHKSQVAGPNGGS